ncbi:MAG: MBL fold metallo-hydrolase [Clostridia bacterium]|nr:MBL fold metallo-hydrolase [Clostridia bacterium]
MIKLKYGNTNTFFIHGNHGGLLVDTDYAGTLPAFYKAIKREGITLKEIHYVLATHYHPDHMGLIGQLTESGVRLLLIDAQKESVHFSDRIFDRDKLPYLPVSESEAAVISCAESRAFLFSLGIEGEILHTPSHSEDSVSLILDDGNCLVGDLEPMEYASDYSENEVLKRDWKNILSFNPKTVFYSHRPETTVT